MLAVSIMCVQVQVHCIINDEADQIQVKVER